MKTDIPNEIQTIEQAKAYLKSLYDNGEDYHPEDDAFGICWSMEEHPTEEEMKRMNKVMEDIYDLGNFDPCGYLLDLDNVPNIQKSQGKFWFTGYDCFYEIRTENLDKGREGKNWTQYSHVEDAIGQTVDLDTEIEQKIISTFDEWVDLCEGQRYSLTDEG